MIYKSKFKLIILIIALLIRLPLINDGIPYFQHEDEAHHHNRNVNMLKTGDLNPNYFHKPSLHFYLRLPALAVGFFETVRRGEIKEISEVKTEDPFGIAGYSFSTSHPLLLKANKFLSILISVACIFLIYEITLLISKSHFTANVAGILATIAPPLINYSSYIGVDIPMTFFVLLSVYFALRFSKNDKLSLLFFSSLSAGLAISTKYNAFPIYLIPLMSVAINKDNTIKYLIALIVPILGFLIGSPYILSSIPLFLNQFAYEIWHYSVEGHSGHSETPGLNQALFYTKWLYSYAIGVAALVLSFVGFLFYFKKGLLVYLFPVLFFLLMIFQKTNFERNMISIIPFICIFTSLAFIKIKNNYLRIILLIAVITQPIFYSIDNHLIRDKQVESRIEAYDYINKLPKNKDIILDGKIQFVSFISYNNGDKYFSHPGIDREDLDNLNLNQLWNNGYDIIVYSSDYEYQNVKTLKNFKGDKLNRIVINPQVNIAEITPKRDEITIKTYLVKENKIKCEEVECWINNRLFKLSSNKSVLKLNIFSPFNNSIKFNNQTFNLKTGSNQIEIKNFKNTEVFELEYVKSPFTQGISNDTRRLGILINEAL